MEEHEYLSATVEPTFIQMGADHLINLNTVQQIKLDKDLSEVKFIFPEYNTASFAVEDCDSFHQIIKNMIPYYSAIKGEGV